MIPKTIHYVWLGNAKKPALIRKCLKSWRKNLPDFKIKCWDLSSIPHNSWVDEAISVKKWAFVADYVRLYALYKEGGIYLDTDVFIKKDFSDLLDTPFFIPIEYNEQKFFATGSDGNIDACGSRISKDVLVQGLTAQSAVIGSEKENPMLKEMMEYYETNHFILPDGSLNYEFLAPDLIATKLENYGFKYKNENYDLIDKDSAQIYGKSLSTDIFASGIATATNGCYAIHMYSSTWKDYSGAQRLMYRAKQFVKTALLCFR